MTNVQGVPFTIVKTEDCLEFICEPGPLAVTVPGTHYFKIYAWSEGVDQTFERYDPDTRQNETVTYKLPGGLSGPSKEAVLIVTDGIPVPDPAPGCSVRRFINP